MANAITLSGAVISAASSPNPDMCRISGYLINAMNQPLAGWAFVLRYCSPLGLAAGTVVMQERMNIKADADGYVEFDLLRGAAVTAEMPNLLSWLNSATLKVPDLASLDLMAFLFPYIASVAWVDAGPLAISVDETFVIALEGTLTNGETVALTSGSLTIVSSNVAVVALTEGFTYRGVSAGSETLTVTAFDASVLELQQDQEGADLVFFDIPAPTLPAALSVVVS